MNEGESVKTTKPYRLLKQRVLILKRSVMRSSDGSGRKLGIDHYRSEAKIFGSRGYIYRGPQRDGDVSE